MKFTMIHMLAYLLFGVAAYPLQKADASPLYTLVSKMHSKKQSKKHSKKHQKARAESTKFVVTNAALYLVLHRTMVSLVSM